MAFPGCDRIVHPKVVSGAPSGSYELLPSSVTVAEPPDRVTVLSGPASATGGVLGAGSLTLTDCDVASDAPSLSVTVRPTV